MRRFIRDIHGTFTEVRSEVPELPVRPIRPPVCEVLREEQERTRQAYVDAARKSVADWLSRGPW